MIQNLSHLYRAAQHTICKTPPVAFAAIGLASIVGGSAVASGKVVAAGVFLYYHGYKSFMKQFDPTVLKNMDALNRGISDAITAPLPVAATVVAVAGLYFGYVTNQMFFEQY